MVSKKIKRVRDTQFTVRVTHEEKKLINENASATTHKNGASLMRELGLGFQPKSIVDKHVADELSKLSGQLGKIGGLLKLSTMKLDDADFRNVEKLESDLVVLREEIAGVRGQINGIFGYLVKPEIQEILHSTLKDINKRGGRYKK